MKLLSGDNVRHKTHGIGVVLKEWGMWPVCRRCLGELAKAGKCPYCGNVEDHPLQVSGKGTFDVQFVSGIESINIDWLKRV